MSLPLSSSIEIPILQELSAVGGTDDVRFIYERLISYFPSLSDAEVFQIQTGENQSWKKAVQKAGKILDENKLIERDRGIWTILKKGLEIVQNETSDFTANENFDEPLSHQIIQGMLCEIGNVLGFDTVKEFEYYDVIWRKSEISERLSHVFEVQSKGNIDSAFAKLKRAFDAQRSKPFLILASERDTNRANKSLKNEFHELSDVITILSFFEIRKIFENLNDLKNILPKLLDD